MTIREAGNGVVENQMATYLIGFNGNDETELDANSMDDLEELWNSLCQEFECEPDSVDYVDRVVQEECL